MSERWICANVVLDSREAINAAVENQADSVSSNCMSITLKDCHLDTTAAAMVINIFRKNDYRVKEIVLNKCTGHLDKILTVVLTCTMLDSLSILMGNSRSEAFDPLAHALGVGLLTNSSLRTLLLCVGSNCNFFTLTLDAAVSLEQGIRGNTSLYSLHINNCRFAERGALRIFAAGIQRIGCLRDVRFASCFEPNGQPLEDYSVAHLIRALEHNSKLEHLDLSRNKCIDIGMAALASLIDRTQLRKLNVSSQRMDQNQFMNTFHLVGALGRTLTLESLQLQSNNLSSDYDMANLAATLTHNTSIKCIDLSDNNIEGSAMNILSSRIPSMKVLENLLVDNNYEFDENTSQNLAKGMKENEVIRIIKCDQNLVDFKTIQYYADLNWGGRRFITQSKSNGKDYGEINPSIPLSLWPQIISRIGGLSEDCERRANVVYYLLQRGSAVFPV